MSSVLPVMVEPKLAVAAKTVRSTSDDVVLILALTSLEAATSAVCALSALDWILSVVVAVAAPSDRSISAEIDLICAAASAEVAAKESCACCALFRMDVAVSAPTAVSVRSTSPASDLTWLGGVGGGANNVARGARGPVWGRAGG